MQFTKLVPLFFSLIATTSAAPSSKPFSVKRDNDTSLYKLKTEVINGGDDNLSNLFVQTYHTGAGHSDATLGDWDGGRWGFLNDTMMQFNFNGYPWNFEMGSDTTYNAWYPVQINGDIHSSQFFYDETGLQWNTSTFGGWLACTWSHGVPQLFWKTVRKSSPSPVCSQVRLYFAPSEDALMAVSPPVLSLRGEPSAPGTGGLSRYCNVNLPECQ